MPEQQQMHTSDLVGIVAAILWVSPRLAESLTPDARIADSVDTAVKILQRAATVKRIVPK